MTVGKIISKIITENECSIEMAEQLTETLHNGRYLHKDLVLRFRPLYGDFDIVPRAWMEGFGIVEDTEKYYIGAFNMPNHALHKAAEATQAYEKFLATK